MAERFPIRVDRWLRALYLFLGAGARVDYVALEGDTVNVRLGWMFRADLRRSAIRRAQHHADMYGGWGAHGFRGRWLVNGSSKGIVQLDLDPAGRAWLMGLFPLKLRTLYLSLEDPDALLSRLAVPG